MLIEKLLNHEQFTESMLCRRLFCVDINVHRRTTYFVNIVTLKYTQGIKDHKCRHCDVFDDVKNAKQYGFS